MKNIIHPHLWNWVNSLRNLVKIIMLYESEFVIYLWESNCNIITVNNIYVFRNDILAIANKYLIEISVMLLRKITEFQSTPMSLKCMRNQNNKTNNYYGLNCFYLKYVQLQNLCIHHVFEMISVFLWDKVHESNPANMRFLAWALNQQDFLLMKL